MALREISITFKFLILEIGKKVKLQNKQKDVLSMNFYSDDTSEGDIDYLVQNFFDNFTLEGDWNDCVECG